MATADELVYVKTNIGGYFFDAFMRVDHVSRLSITQHPVETGAAVSDHAYIEPTSLNMDVKMSDAATSVASGQFGGGPTRSISAYEVLLELQKQRIPFRVVTRLKIYDNMLVESLDVSDDASTLYGLKATVSLREVLIAVVATVKLSKKPQTTDTSKKGVVEPKHVKESTLYQITEYLNNLSYSQ